MTEINRLFSFSRTQVAQLFAHGKSFARGSSLKLIVAPAEPGQGVARLLIITSRRIGKACERNLLRRRVKEIFYGSELYKLKPGNYALLTYPGVTKLTYDELKTFFITSFQRP